mmetsp:Transcript_22616/g.67356  ORF Transcript_22616/g.67356 Transcript_22616/m.67356 type:complete len:228 (-) Transcript_22616:1199-1882(-)
MHHLHRQPLALRVWQRLHLQPQLPDSWQPRAANPAGVQHVKRDKLQPADAPHFPVNLHAGPRNAMARTRGELVRHQQPRDAPVASSVRQVERETLRRRHARAAAVAAAAPGPAVEPAAVRHQLNRARRRLSRGSGGLSAAAAGCGGCTGNEGPLSGACRLRRDCGKQPPRGGPGQQTATRVACLRPLARRSRRRRMRVGFKPAQRRHPPRMPRQACVPATACSRASS